MCVRSLGGRQYIYLCVCVCVCVFVSLCAHHGGEALCEDGGKGVVCVVEKRARAQGHESDVAHDGDAEVAEWVGGKEAEGESVFVKSGANAMMRTC